MGEMNPQRAAMGGKLLDVDQLELVPGREPLDRDQGEIRKVLMVDRVELVLGNQPLEVRELQRDHAFRFQQPRHTRYEIVEIGNLSEHIVADDQVRALAFSDQVLGELDAEKLGARRNTLVDRDFGDIDRGLDAEHGHARAGRKCCSR